MPNHVLLYFIEINGNIRLWVIILLKKTFNYEKTFQRESIAVDRGPDDFSMINTQSGKSYIGRYSLLRDGDCDVEKKPA
jgi:hypothetical protein